MEREGEKEGKGREGRAVGKEGGKESIKQLSSKNTVNHLSTASAFLLPSEQPSPLPSLPLHPDGESLVQIPKVFHSSTLFQLLVLFLISDIINENE